MKTTADLFATDGRADRLKDGWFPGLFVAQWLWIWESPHGQTCIWAYEVDGKWMARFSPAGPYQEIEPREGGTREVATIALMEAAEAKPRPGAKV